MEGKNTGIGFRDGDKDGLRGEAKHKLFRAHIRRGGGARNNQGSYQQGKARDWV